MRKNNVILIGMPGCGKTTIGTELSEKMGYGYIDSDSVIVAREGKRLNEIIAEEKLKADETKKFVDNAIADGEMRTTGTDIDKLMPPISRFGNTNREKKKQTIIEKLKAFFERFFGV